MNRAKIQNSQVLSARRGDRQAFSVLVTECQQTLYSAAMAILRNEQDALDAVQDAIFLAWRKLESLREPQYFTTWLTRIVIRTAINLRRRRRPQAALSEMVVALPERGPGREAVIDIRRAMCTLDEKTRLCAELYYYEGFSVDEVASATGIRPGTVKSSLFRARKQLREALREEYNAER